MHANVLTNRGEIQSLLRGVKRIAVLGIKTEAQSGQPAFYVPKYLQDAGFEIVPVPVYFPEARTILGEPVYHTLASIPGDVDLVDVFRRSHDLAPHVPDILAKRPRAVWFQLGIRDDAVAEELAAAGIQVVQDQCLMVAHRSMTSSS